MMREKATRGKAAFTVMRQGFNIVKRAGTGNTCRECQITEGLGICTRM